MSVLCFSVGVRVPNSHPSSRYCATEAANQCFPPAQYAFGLCYAEGRGVEKDEREAVKWYTKAAKQGDPDAQKKLEDC